jgi:prolyl 4-hydroxylase
MRKKLDESWKRWLAENLERECDPHDLVSTLLENRFSLESIRENMGDSFPVGPGHESQDGPDYQRLSEVRLTKSSSTPGLRRVPSDKLQIYVLDDFMSASECNAMLGIIGEQLRPSTVTLDRGDKYFRTSSTCDLSLLDEPLISEIDERIAKTLGVRVPYSEGIQAQRYDLGQEFKAHTDYFERGTAEFWEYAAQQGNRTWTFMVNLNDGMEGGATDFPAIDESFPPRKGRAVIWNNLYANGVPNPDSLHSGSPVTKGHKIVITKWFRERGSGPMFYEANDTR